MSPFAEVTAVVMAVVALVCIFIPLVTTACVYSETGCSVAPYELISVVHQANDFPIAGPVVVSLFYYLVALFSAASSVLICIPWTFEKPHRVMYTRLLYTGNTLCAIGACVSAGIVFSGSAYAGLGEEQTPNAESKIPRVSLYSILAQVSIAIVSGCLIVLLRPVMKTTPIQMPTSGIHSSNLNKDLESERIN
uniref:Uncharacterized protein n=1 Tax=Mucochytrium quahogii TaxID=96639 RepID=A0A7S2SAK7_9STRA|mmetsp:Transcript_16485/g.28596  ORF Transcript_16485/g.28596 Transcript_16485/m.28596 type:complete len:193 (+) Transcript_16485:174-752(+)